MLCAKGYSAIRYAYDEKGNVTREAWYDTEDRPMTLGDTYCAVVRAYNDDKQVVYTQYLEENGYPIASKAGYAAVRREFSGKTVTKESYFDPSDQPVLSADGYATVITTLTGDKVMAVAYLDTAGNPVNCAKGYCEIRYAYDADGKQEAVTYWTVEGAEVDKNGQPLVAETEEPAA